MFSKSELKTIATVLDHWVGHTFTCRSAGATLQDNAIILSLAAKAERLSVSPEIPMEKKPDA